MAAPKLSPAARLRDLEEMKKCVSGEISVCHAYIRDPDRLAVEIEREQVKIRNALSRIALLEGYADTERLHQWQARYEKLGVEILHAKHAADIERVMKLLASRDELSADVGDANFDRVTTQAACTDSQEEGVPDAS